MNIPQIEANFRELDDILQTCSVFIRNQILLGYSIYTPNNRSDYREIKEETTIKYVIKNE